MIPKLRRSKVLPDSVHDWRGRNWAKLQRTEQRTGDALRIMRAFNILIESHKKALALLGGQKPNPSVLTRKANAIIVLASELTDEVLRRENEMRLPEETWNEAYVNCMMHFWKKIPHDLRQEMIRLTPKREKK